MSLKTRDTKIDLLRFIGVALVILCHVAPPQAIGAIRSFDVPLLVMISGVSFTMSYHELPYGKYVVKRFKRLVLPVWVFLAIYIPAEDLMRFVLNKELIPTGMVLSSFALIEGISYVWIFRVYFLMALISPLLLKLSEKLGTTRFLALLAVIYPLYELMTGFVMRQSSLVFQAFELIVIYAIGYGFICAVGIVLRKLGRAQYRAVYYTLRCLCGAHRTYAVYRRRECALYSKIPTAHAVYCGRASCQSPAVASF